MKKITLAQRLTLVFALLLLGCSALTVWIQYQNRNRYSDAMIQNLSRNLATSIAQNRVLMNARGTEQTALKALFSQMMAYNPSVEVYLIDNKGNILADAAPAGHIRRQRISLTPLHQLLAGKTLPVYGDDPRSVRRQKVFSATQLRVDGKPAGYLYVILQGEDYNQLNHDALSSALQHSMLWSVAIILLCGLIAGSFAFWWVTRPVRNLTRQVSQLDNHSQQLIERLAASPLPRQQDEVAQLRTAFINLARHISEQWTSLALKDDQRREFIANISHDLRTPLMSVQGYLETLSVKSHSLSDAERRRYLSIALIESEKVGALAQQLFELARLEHGVVTPQCERFSLPDLVQDVIQKFELPMTRHRQALRVEIAKPLPLVDADMSMIERVLTNLIDNAIRHTPDEGEIRLHIWNEAQQLVIEVADSGPGIAAELKATLFERPSISDASRRDNGGLGLMIVRRMLQLHQGDIRLIDVPTGACFRLFIPVQLD
ncbi:two-component sensor histidine kinase [Izhakiella australiensis]|uniref:histidine kinase n=1 Tax=Izhakiella australiensis TaxID=1926881 RepID=A0A1S8YNK9_9GAMM|nr:HAMP domain-containing sensor histidine kinase [Izhakiella australiensis]OON40223.1 two-component sensor histidine kinase [Izhakiella australiensis]